ncbi:non-ribosomal peptide synthetase [Speluncibacter jeojiensis]|uniref:non-ribosomal peptide synthetase n=1 Tax=Speluncibacter jeojiensis TaxID=2710754 RepID=UPI0024103AC7|nr:non-ribosomal peptide synthetase [Rhodococcus sp. D2-41]
MTIGEHRPTTQRSAALADRRAALLQRRIAQSRLGSAPEPTASGPRDLGVRHPLAPAQQRMWFLQHLSPDDTTLNVCTAYTLTGPLDVERLHRALAHVIARHDILRTTYHQDDAGAPCQRVDGDTAPDWAFHDLVDGADPAPRLRELARAAFARPYRLERDHPLRAVLARTGPDEHVLVLVVHHVAWDDDCWGVFFGDLTRAYLADTAAGFDTAADLETARAGAVHLLDVEVLAGRDTGTGAAEGADLDYWRGTLAGLPEPIELPGEPAGARTASTAARHLERPLRADLLDRVRALARAEGATPFMVLLAAFDAVAHRYTGADDFLVATPVVNRRGEAEGALGYFGNTVVLRARVRPRDTFRELLHRTREMCLGAFAHQQLGIDRLVQQVGPERGAGIESLIRLSFGARSADGAGFCPPGIGCARADLRSAVAQVPVGVMVEFGGADGATLEFEHQVEVIDDAVAANWSRHLATFLESALAAPDSAIAALDLLGEDRVAALELSTGPRLSGGTATTLVELVERQAAATPDAVALVADTERITYAQLDTRANRLARRLIAQGIGPEDLVALAYPRSPEMVVAAVATLKAGAAYLPIDPDYPADRIEYMLADAAPALQLGPDDAESAAAGFPDTAPTDADRTAPLRPDNIAYVIYTSGSTGRPKGVPVSHRAIVEHLTWLDEEYAPGPDDVLLQVASTSFDVSVGEIFGALVTGGRLVIPRPDGLQDIGYLTALLRDEAVTTMHFVPSLLGLLLQLPGIEEWTSLRRIPIGGEALPGELADAFHRTFDAQLHNFYGPTEATLAATRYPVEGPQGTRVAPIGSPKANTEVYLLDASLQLAPTGVIGEIYIGGSQLARGYLGRRALTAERFVADPFVRGGRLYRTGDLARWNSEGQIEFVGRADEQVKIRGFRIELGEVQAAVASHPGVAQSAVAVHESPELGRSLAAYVVPVGAPIPFEQLRSHVAGRLPAHMVPTAYATVDAIPLTPNGKLDRRALPTPQPVAAGDSRDPQGPVEIALCAIFADSLGRERVGVDESFFDLGGHSLLATRLVARLRADFGVEVTVREAFDAPTVAGLAALIEVKRSAFPDAATRPPLVRADRPDELPLSYAQLRQWFLYRMEGANPTYNIPFAARIDGPLDVAALTAAVGDVVARHEILRTTYPDRDGTPRQQISAPAPVPIPVHDVVETDLDAELKRLGDHTFELDRDLPLRVTLLQLGPDRHVLSLLLHHIAGDEWSAPVLLGDLTAAYRARRTGTPPQWEPPQVQYADYALWQRELLGLDREPGADPEPDTVGAEQIAYWRDTLAGLPDDTAVLRDRPRPAVASARGDTVEFTVPRAIRDSLTAMGRSCGASDFMVLQTAVATLLARLGAGDDVPLGTPIAGRTEHGLASLIGFFVNTVVVRNDLSGDPTPTVAVTRARDAALGAYAHQDLPFERLVDALRPDRSLSRHPVFQVLVQVREAGELSGAFGGDEQTRLTAIEPRFDTAKFDLTFDFCAVASGTWQGGINFRTDLYDRATIEAMATRLLRVLAAFATEPDRTIGSLDLLGDDERRQVLGELSRSRDTTATAPRTVVELLETSRVVTDPNRAALRCNDSELTYGQLYDRADRLAAVLRGHGAGPETVVALAVPRSIDMVVAFVATMRSGAAFLPLDLRYPAQRLAQMIDRAGPVCVVTTSAAAGSLPAGAAPLLLDTVDLEQVAPAAPAKVHPDNAAYFLYTSGSTGVPKGVLGTHGAMAGRLAWQPELFPVRAVDAAGRDTDTRLAQGSLSFLDGGLELLAGLAAGATLVVADDAQARDLEALAGLIRSHPIGQVTAVSSAVTALVESAPDAVASVPRWVCSGEPLTGSLLSGLRRVAPGGEVVNGYGATETAGSIVRGVIDDRIKVGRPVPGVQILLLDERLRPVPRGMVGEVYVAGDQLARGYWAQSGVTGARFVANPYPATPGERLYRTGDRGRWNDGGDLEFAGRTDHQVKVRGFRIELAEVEAALRGAPGVTAAAARTWELGGASSLAGYVVLDTGVDEAAGADPVDAVRAHLSRTLPGYMVPSSLTVLGTMPLTGSGKLDRLALPEPRVRTGGAAEPPRTDTERILAALLRDLLAPAGEVGRGDGFFALGGDSILSIQLAGRARAEGLTISPQLIFENPTVAELAAACDRAAEETAAVADTAQPEPPSAPMSASGLDTDALAALRASWSNR